MFKCEKIIEVNNNLCYFIYSRFSVNNCYENWNHFVVRKNGKIKEVCFVKQDIDNEAAYVHMLVDDNLVLYDVNGVKTITEGPYNPFIESHYYLKKLYMLNPDIKYITSEQLISLLDWR